MTDPDSVRPTALGVVSGWGAGHLSLLIVVCALGTDLPWTDAVCQWSGTDIDRVMGWLSSLGNPAPVTTLAIGSAVLALAVGRPIEATVLVLVPWAATTSCNLLKDLIHRPRPTGACVAQVAEGFSFPSGHAVGVSVGFVLPVVWMLYRAGRSSSPVLIAVMVLVNTVQVSRVALGAHHLSDVLAGQVLGVAWLLPGLWLLRRCRQQCGPRRGPAMTDKDVTGEMTPEPGAARLGVTCVVRGSDGTVLVGLRRQPPRWELPGGFVDAGESIIEAAEREVLEETGVTVRCTNFISLYHHVSRQIIAAVVEGRQLSGSPQESDEMSVVRWMSPDEAVENLHPLYRTRLQDVLKSSGRPTLWAHEGVEVLGTLPVPPRQVPEEHSL